MASSASTPTARYLAAIVSSSDDAIISKDLNGIVTSWNSAAERMFGYTAEEIIGQSIRLIIPDERQPEEDDVLRRIRAGESVDHFETVRLRKDGLLIPVSLTVSPIRDLNGAVIGASTIAHDVSERKRIEAQLAVSKAARDDLHRRLAMLIAASATLVGTPELSVVVQSALSLARDLVAADACAIWRLQANIGWEALGSQGLSAEFAQTTRCYGTDELWFTEPLVIEDVQESATVAPRRQELADEGIASMLVVPLVLHGRREGVLVFYHRRSHRYSDVDVDTARALGNLTAAAMTTAELFGERERAGRAAFLGDASRTLSTSLDYREMVTEVSRLSVPRFADWCAVDLVDRNGSADEGAFAHLDESKVALGHEWQQRCPISPDWEGSPKRVMATGHPVLTPQITDAVLVKATDGNPESLQLIRTLGLVSHLCVPLQGQHGVMGAVTFGTGTSGRHFTEDDLATALELARRVADAIEKAQVYQEGQRANRLKDTFLATLSHELRTPLTAVLGYTRMLRSNALPENKRDQALHTIERNAMRVSQMVHDLLDVSRITSGKLALTMQPISLQALVRESVESMAPSASAKGVDLQAHFDDNPFSIDGDQARLQQVFWNLLSNAVKFTPAGGRVDVVVRGGKKSATVIVRDSGIGIAPAFRSRVFEPFQQGSNKSTRELGGLGLGLAIVRQIVQLHGGTVTVDSEGEGKGSTFTVRLPRRQMVDQAAVELSTNLIPRASEPTHFVKTIGNA